jgi:hypothetical protein
MYVISYIHIQGNRYQWIKPEIPVIEVEAEYGLPLTIGQDVLYWFEGGVRGELSVVSRLRIDDETSENLYDVYHKADPTRRAICITRDLLVIPAASSEETRYIYMCTYIYVYSYIYIHTYIYVYIGCWSWRSSGLTSWK